MSHICVIVGAGHAAAQLSLSLRQEGWDGRIVLVGDETSVPYHRPPLSKEYLLGNKRTDEIAIRQLDFYVKNGIELLLGESVVTLDRDAKRINLGSGKSVSYDKLALCTGARARKVVLPGVQLKGVHYLRNIKDVQGMKQHIGPGRNAVIIGGGYIGLETGAVLRKLGMRVTVLERASRVLARVTAPEVSEFYARVHSEEGVVIETGVAVNGFDGVDHVEAVLSADGRRFPADLVVIGIGVDPNVELAERAGLRVDNGILVDEFTCTLDSDIVAVGDCSRLPLPLYGYVRIESVPNAIEQAKSAAATLCGKNKAYTALPWFWSDQYDCKLQIAGINQGHDQIVVRGDPTGSRSFAVFYLSEGRIIAADCVNRPQEFMMSKRLISEQLQVNPSQLADEKITFKSLIPS